MVLAHHLIFTGYAHWLANDPRGSGSKQVNSDILRRLGEVHYGRKTIQPAGWEIQRFYEQAEPLLRFPVLEFAESQILIIADAFRSLIQSRPYTCYACAIMPDHVHILIRKHKDPAEEMILQLQNASRAALGSQEFGGPEHPIWTHGGWKVFLDTPDQIRRTIVYIIANPIHEGLPPQTWDFVKAYDGWPYYHVR